MVYEVYQYNIPKISEDGKKAIPVPGSQLNEFANIDDARKFVVERKDKFDRVVLVRKGDEGQKMVEQYVDGRSC